MVFRIEMSSRFRSSWCCGMSRPITCTLCGNMVDDSDTVMMPNGAMCFDPCYIWLERIMDEEDEIWGDDDDDEYVMVFESDGEEEESW